MFRFAFSFSIVSVRLTRISKFPRLESKLKPKISKNTESRLLFCDTYSFQLISFKFYEFGLNLTLISPVFYPKFLKMLYMEITKLIYCPQIDLEDKEPPKQ